MPTNLLQISFAAVDYCTDRTFRKKKSVVDFIKPAQPTRRREEKQRRNNNTLKVLQDKELCVVAVKSYIKQLKEDRGRHQRRDSAR